MSNLERRDFIKKTVIGGMGVVLLNEADVNSKIKNSHEENFINKSGVTKKIIVGGAGIGGLCCAYELMKKGHEVTVLEASSRHGGHVLTAHDGLSDGLYGDFGQEHIAKPGYTFYFGYTKEFDLEVVPYPRRKEILRRIEGKFYTEEMLADPVILRKFGWKMVYPASIFI